MSVHDQQTLEISDDTTLFYATCLRKQVNPSPALSNEAKTDLQ
jgi:hypothetical protein